MNATQPILVDIDGTLADTADRIRLLPRHRPPTEHEYNHFNASAGQEPPIRPVCDLVATLHHAGTPIVFTTGRPDHMRAVTASWLTRTTGIPEPVLYMRAAGDHRPDNEVKHEFLETMRNNGLDPALAIDDRPRVIDMWRKAGLVCLDPGTWIDRTRPEPGHLVLLVTTEPHHARPASPGSLPSAATRFSDNMLCSDTLHDRFPAPPIKPHSHHTPRHIRYAAEVASANILNGITFCIASSQSSRRERLQIRNALPPHVPTIYYLVDRPIETKLASQPASRHARIRARHRSFLDQLSELVLADRQHTGPVFPCIHANAPHHVHKAAEQSPLPVMPAPDLPFHNPPRD